MSFMDSVLSALNADNDATFGPGPVPTTPDTQEQILQQAVNATGASRDEIVSFISGVADAAKLAEHLPRHVLAGTSAMTGLIVGARLARAAADNERLGVTP